MGIHRGPTITVHEIIAEHRLVPAFDDYTGGVGEIPAGVPGSETLTCESENHRFEEDLVHDGECHVRILAAELERLEYQRERLVSGEDVLPTDAALAALLRELPEGWNAIILRRRDSGWIAESYDDRDSSKSANGYGETLAVAIQVLAAKLQKK